MSSVMDVDMITPGCSGSSPPVTGRRWSVVRGTRVAWPAGRCARQQEGLVGGQGVIDRGWILVLGGEPVVHRDDLGAGPPADLGGQAGDLGGVPQDVHAA